MGELLGGERSAEQVLADYDELTLASQTAETLDGIVTEVNELLRATERMVTETSSTKPTSIFSRDPETGIYRKDKTVFTHGRSISFIGNRLLHVADELIVADDTGVGVSYTSGVHVLDETALPECYEAEDRYLRNVIAQLEHGGDVSLDLRRY